MRQGLIKHVSDSRQNSQLLLVTAEEKSSLCRLEFKPSMFVLHFRFSRKDRRKTDSRQMSRYNGIKENKRSQNGSKIGKRDCCTREAAEHSVPDQKIDGDICVWQPEGLSASHTHSQYFVFKIFF